MNGFSLRHMQNRFYEILRDCKLCSYINTIGATSSYFSCNPPSVNASSSKVAVIKTNFKIIQSQREYMVNMREVIKRQISARLEEEFGFLITRCITPQEGCSQGVVFEATDLATGENVAIKVTDMKNHSAKLCFKRELNVYNRIRGCSQLLQMKRSFILKLPHPAAANTTNPITMTTTHRGLSEKWGMVSSSIKKNCAKKRKFGVVVLPFLQSDGIEWIERNFQLLHRPPRSQHFHYRYPQFSDHENNDVISSLNDESDDDNDDNDGDDDEKKGEEWEEDEYRELKMNLKEICRKMAEQIADLHSHGYAHLDIKPDNFLLSSSYHHSSSSSSSPSPSTSTKHEVISGHHHHRDRHHHYCQHNRSEMIDVQICDFGAAHRFGDHLSRRVGTCSYMSPEMISLSPSWISPKRSQKSSSSLLLSSSSSSSSSSSHTLIDFEKCDVWSLGVSLFAMQTGMLPYVYHDGRMVSNQAALLLVSPSFFNLFSHMLDANPHSRFGIEDVLNHSWWSSTSL